MTADWYGLLSSIDLYYVATGGWLMKQLVRFGFPPEVLRKISSRITNEVAGINRVTYDISSKPPAVCLIFLNWFELMFIFDRLWSGYKRSQMLFLVR